MTYLAFAEQKNKRVGVETMGLACDCKISLIAAESLLGSVITFVKLLLNRPSEMAVAFLPPFSCY